MFYAILTEAGRSMPFNHGATAPTVPGDPLRVSEDATLLAFEGQPDRVFATKYARASGKVLWHVTEQTLHPRDLPPTEMFSSYHDFQVWLGRDTEQETGRATAPDKR